ncbi:hypothetical protein I3760_10G056900 [Carya illinoinensis]|nr:hypothetical protein I3760_10G056900 [Carya illinoinensis]
MELEGLKTRMEDERKESEKKVKAMEADISELKRTALDRNRVELIMDNDDISSSQRFQGLIEVSVKSNLIKNLKKGTKCVDSSLSFENQKLEGPDSKKEDTENERPRHSRCNSEDLAESSESALSNLRSRLPRVPKPPPRPSSTTLSPSTSPNSPFFTSESNAPTEQPIPPPPPAKRMVPPPPPPPPKGLKGVPAKVRREPEVVEFYHSLMRRDSRRDSGTTSEAAPATANTRDMIGEIENRSSHLLAIKSDVETQGDFIRFLIKEVESAAFTDIEDVVPFVKWLDDELCYLVDERAVLKHFEWPEQKADALREAAFGYCDLKKLESEASSFRDDARQPCVPALKKMQALLEK